MTGISLLVLALWSAFVGSVDVRLFSTMKRWLPKLHIGNCFALDFILMALFIVWYSMVIVLVPASLVARWIFGPPGPDVFFLVPREFMLSVGVGFVIGVAWRLAKTVSATRKQD